MRAITKRHERSEKKIQSDCANSHEADIGGKVEDSCAHGQRETGMGVQTARHGLTLMARTVQRSLLQQRMTADDGTGLNGSIRADAEEQFYVANNPRLPCQRRVKLAGPV